MLSSLRVLLPLPLLTLVACSPVPEDIALPDARTGDAMRRDAGSVEEDAAASAICPPVGPFGMRAGEISPDIELVDCEGVTHSLHELCDREVTWLFEFADWCPPCRAFAMSQANAVYDANVSAHGAAFAGWMVISETADFGTPDAATCATIRDRYGIHMPVLFDPSGALQSALGVPANEVHVVLTEGARIHWVGQYAARQVATRIESAY